MVPVLDQNKQPLMPCSEKRARKLIEKKEAKKYWKHGIFCIILQKEPSARNKQDIIIGIDPGSKRTGITLATKKHVICNQLFDAPIWIKDAIELRKILRRSRRSRKTPYRKCRFNRKIGGLPPSTKARWQMHLRVINFWKKLVPLTNVVIENIQAKTVKGNGKSWNKNFSPLEVGKKYFEREVANFSLQKVKGYETKSHRVSRGFKKLKDKLADKWEAHNVDSHCLCEIALKLQIPAFKGIVKCELMQWHRRQLHTTTPKLGGTRRTYGSTRSLGITRGTLVYNSYLRQLLYVGGTSKDKFSLHHITSGRRVTQSGRMCECKILTTLRWRSHFVPFRSSGNIS